MAPNTKLSPEEIRKKVLADPNTAQIAEKLGVSLDEYVNQVVFFVLNPNAEPSLYVVEDEDLRSMGVEPSTEDDVGKYLMEAIAIAKAANPSTTEYSDAKKKLVEMPDTPAPNAEKPKDPTLESDVNKSRRVGG
jgi:hypothetical protein